MNILILNGSPAGEGSITLQTVLYIREYFPEHDYEILNVGQRIKAIERVLIRCGEAASGGGFGGGEGFGGGQGGG